MADETKSDPKAQESKAQNPRIAEIEKKYGKSFEELLIDCVERHAAYEKAHEKRK